MTPHPGRSARATVVTLRLPTLALAGVYGAEGPPGSDYLFGLLAFRELPLVLAAMATMPRPPQRLFYDGNGILRPRGCGAASHLGVLLDLPSIGSSKNVRDLRPFPPLECGAVRRLECDRGALVVIRDGSNRICVSPGHRCDLDSVIAATLAVSRSRLPEPIRMADRQAAIG